MTLWFDTVEQPVLTNPPVAPEVIIGLLAVGAIAGIIVHVLLGRRVDS